MHGSTLNIDFFYFCRFFKNFFVRFVLFLRTTFVSGVWVSYPAVLSQIQSEVSQNEAFRCKFGYTVMYRNGRRWVRRKKSSHRSLFYWAILPVCQI